MKHWRIDDVEWARFDVSKVDPEMIPLVKAAALVERNGTDYAIYLNNVFADDPDFRNAADNWAVEEVQHGEALGRWAMLADPGWDFRAAFHRYRDGFRIPLDIDESVRGSRTGELIARCMVETGTSSYYTALGEAAREPVLRELCRLIAADEYRHFKLFYDHMKRYLARERLNFVGRLRIALGRISESEDDELAFAFHCANVGPPAPYRHDACLAAYLGTAIGYYQFRHVDRGVSMILKAVGLDPHGKVAIVASRLSWRLLQRRRRRMSEQMVEAPLARAA
jgi:hypothetical protein